MWLHPFFHNVASVALGIYYRLSRAGHDVPRDGPVLLVANHPNSLVDPALVAYGADRPVRFLAKSTLFTKSVVGRLVAGSGAIPVYRRVDDPSQMARNEETFSAVHESLAAGDAVGLFPEGISHNNPSLAPLKTGAARIALGAAALTGRDFPIIPLGLVFERKSVFRSSAHVIVGRRVEWRDLAHAGERDGSAVRELTRRIDAALRDVTINLEQWEDAPIVELAESIYAAENSLRDDPVERVERLKQTTDVLSALRASGNASWENLAEELRVHGRMLRYVGLTPKTLKLAPTTSGAIWWSARRVPLAVAAASGVWLAGAILFWPPYKLTGWLGKRFSKNDEVLVTTVRLLGGTLAFALWIMLLSIFIAAAAGIGWGVVAFVTLPFVAMGTLVLRESLRAAIRDVRAFFTVTRGKHVIEDLRAKQMEIVDEIGKLL